MATASLNGSARTDRGTGIARKLRRDGKIPAVIYGHGREPQSLTIEARELEKLLSTVSAASTVIELSLGGAVAKTLIRELQEELGIVVQEPCLAPLTFASHAYPDFHLLMPLYVCRRWEGVVTAREGQRLAWVRPNRLRDYPMPPADVPLVSHLTTLL